MMDGGGGDGPLTSFVPLPKVATLNKPFSAFCYLLVSLAY